MEVEALERLHLVHARLLYIIAEMHSENLIDEVQKVNLKSNFSLLSSLVRVFKDEKQIFDIYDIYKEDIATLETKLANLEPSSLQPNGQGEGNQLNMNGKSNSMKGREFDDRQYQLQIQASGSDFDDISSPMDAQITKKKKLLKLVHEKEAAKKGNTAATTADNTVGPAGHFGVQVCDDGASPMLQKLPKPRK